MKNKQVIISAIIVIVVGAGMFYGGTRYEKSKSPAAGLMKSGNFAQGGARGGQGQAQQQGQAQGAVRNGNRQGGGFLGGSILSKDDKSITIKLQDGSTKVIYFSDSTSVGKTDPGTASDLAAGQQVMVSGSESQDGSVTAQNIQIRPADANNSSN
ncbi:MAG: hypothetical protein HGB08_03220 [Candidatus Moranbacteria bacterium]|nr:hypothetical protein [Candidatus Moranbacteria bacterium]